VHVTRHRTSTPMPYVDVKAAARIGKIETDAHDERVARSHATRLEIKRNAFIGFQQFAEVDQTDLHLMGEAVHACNLSFRKVAYGDFAYANHLVTIKQTRVNYVKPPRDTVVVVE